MSVGGTARLRRKNNRLSLPDDEYDTWIRPADWLALPEVTSTEQKIVGLFAVYDDASNFVAFRCTGAITVDWGDGTPTENFASNVTAEHNYAWSNLSSGTLTSDGFRQAIITITPQAGQNITVANFSAYRHSQMTQQTGVIPHYQWLDMRMSLPSATEITFGYVSTQVIRLDKLQSIEILSSNQSSLYYRFANGLFGLKRVFLRSSAAVTEARNAFAVCVNLRDVKLDITIGNGCDGGNMFNTCSSMRRSPTMKFGASGYFWTLTNHFASCQALEEVATYSTASTTVFNNMFNGCSSLKVAPWMNTAAATDMSSMFVNCSELVYVPKYDLNGVTNTSSMFSSCRSLESVPDFDLSTVTNMSSMFNGCQSLPSLPNYTTSAATNMSSIVGNCINLRSVPVFDTDQVTNASNAFAGCSSLRQVPAWNLTGITSSAAYQSIFTSCGSLGSIKAFNMRFTFSVAGCQLGKAALEEIFTNLSRVTTSQALTISNTSPANNYGATTFTKSCSTTSGSADITVNTNTSLITGMYVTGTNLGSTKSVTFQDSGDTVTLTAHGLANGKKVAFSAITSTTGILTYTTYYVVNATTDTFQLAATEGGAALALTTDGSGTLMLVYKVTNINGTTVTLDAPATATGTSQSLVFRDLDVSLATFRGWTVSG